MSKSQQHRVGVQRNNPEKVAEQKPEQVPAIIPTEQPTSYMGMIQAAVAKGASMEQISQLMDLSERHEKNEARKAFAAALSDFKAEPLLIEKDKQVSFQTSKGVTEYKHATLGNTAAIIGAALSRHGLSYRWITEQIEGKIKVTCVLMHKLGHTESVSLQSGADDSGGKNNIQAIGSAVSYLQRYTLLAITGTATMDQDDDGKEGGEAMEVGMLNDYLTAIEAATSMQEVQRAYMPALILASELKDQKTMDFLNAAKDSALEKIAKEPAPT